MPLPNVLLKDPDETKTYTIDFSAGLATSETVSSSTLSITPSGNLAYSSLTNNDTVVQFKLSAGALDTTYLVTSTATTSNSNILQNSFKIAVKDCAWLDEMVIMLRYMINDLASEPVYSDLRLAQTILVAAKYVQTELSLPNTYVINPAALTITPDPTSVSDLAMINFSVLKAACMLDMASLRTAAKTAGVSASLGPARLDTGRQLDGYKSIIEKGPCATYEDCKFDYAIGNINYRAVLGPFVGNQFEIRGPLSNGYNMRNLYYSGV